MNIQVSHLKCNLVYYTWTHSRTKRRSRGGSTEGELVDRLGLGMCKGLALDHNKHPPGLIRKRGTLDPCKCTCSRFIHTSVVCVNYTLLMCMYFPPSLGEDIVFLEFHLQNSGYLNCIIYIICASAEPRLDELKTYSTNFGFLYNISSLNNKSDEDILQCCKNCKCYLRCLSHPIPI
jgi:hypothetical protein